MAKRKDERKEGIDFQALLGSIRGGTRVSGMATSATLEKHFTEGELGERTDLNINDLQGVVWLKYAGETYGLPEYIAEARIWETELISKDRKGRQEIADMIRAKVINERELEEIRLRAQGKMAGRER